MKRDLLSVETQQVPFVCGLGMKSPSGGWGYAPALQAGERAPLGVRGFGGLKPRARCAGFSVAEIGNRKECLRVREAGASAAGRGQRPYASFPGFLPLNPLRTPSPPLKRAGTPCTREQGLRWAAAQTRLRGIPPQTPFFASRRFKEISVFPLSYRAAIA